MVKVITFLIKNPDLYLNSVNWIIYNTRKITSINKNELREAINNFKFNKNHSFSLFNTSNCEYNSISWKSIVLYTSSFPLGIYWWSESSVFELGPLPNLKYNYKCCIQLLDSSQAIKSNHLLVTKVVVTTE